MGASYARMVVREYCKGDDESSVRPSTPFSADTDTPIFCCQPMPIPVRYRYASRADVAQHD